MEQALGAVAGHETVHATDKNEINEDKTVEQNTGDVRTEEVREKKPREIEDQIIEESKRNNDL